MATARPFIAAALAEHDPTTRDEDDDDDETIVGWQTAYYALLLVWPLIGHLHKFATSSS